MPSDGDQSPSIEGFDESLYLSENSDVADAVRRGHFESGLDHFRKYGHRENRSGGPDIPNSPEFRFPGPLPPPELRKRVHGVVQVNSFEKVGRQVAGVLADEVSARIGRSDRPLETLDFGCGCARVLAYLANALDIRATGTDIDAEAIAWCRANLSEIGAFQANGEMPPFDMAANSFDLIFSISVMTHLPEHMQFAWLRELARVARPGALILLTVRDAHGVDLTWRQAALYRWRGFVHCGGRPTPGLPDFYRSAFHSESYVRRRWSEVFEILDYKSRAIGGEQDLVVCKMRRG